MRQLAAGDRRPAGRRERHSPPSTSFPNPQIRQELSALSGWPTIPQVFVKGELVGGADITEELAASGELERKLAEALGEDYRSSATENTVSVV